MEADQNLPIHSELLADHISISGLVQKVLDGFGINTVGDLCCLNLEVVAEQKGVGLKKLETLRDLIEQARDIANYTPENPTSRRLDERRLSQNDDTPLLFVPSLLTEGFRRLEIDCVAKLLQLEERDMAKLPSWGEKKSSATLAVRQLYQTLWGNDELVPSSLLSAIVPAELLPDEKLADLTIGEFCDGKRKAILKGKAVKEANDLRSLFRSFFQNSESFEIIGGMDWRDVPLLVNSRVQDFADRYELRTIAELEQLSMRGWFIESMSGNRINVTEAERFGESSLSNLRSEIARLKAVGLKQYREGVVCGIEEIECPELAWEDIPLRLRSKPRKLLKKHAILTVTEVHRIAVRSQLPCKDLDCWKNVGDVEGFTQAIVDELRREVNQLGSVGLAGYRFGASGQPADCREFIQRVRELLDERRIAMLREQVSGETLDQIV